MTIRHGGKILAGRLRDHGVERVFSVPGESFLAALDGLRETRIRNIVCRQEGGAAMMAEAHAKLTGGPGVVFVTRGPGAANASAGLHVAMHDATPVVCFVGQVPLEHRDRDAFQEVDHRAFFGPLVKWAAEVERSDRIEEYVDRAFAVASSGRPGPVVLALPEDVLSAAFDAPDPAPLPNAAARMPIDDRTLKDAADILAGAERPLIVVGGSRWAAAAARAAADVARRLGAPVATAFRRQDYIDNDHPNYAGDLGVGMNPALGRRLSGADVVLLAGAELNDIATRDFSLLDRARPPRIVQVTTDPDAISKHYPAELALIADPADFFPALCRTLPDTDGRDRGAAAARADREAWRRPRQTPGAVKMERVIRHLAAALPKDAIVTNGAGNYAAFLHRYYRFRRYRTQLAPTSGSMGYGLPAAIAAKLARPARPVVCLAGDGCFQMTLQELSTARQHGVEIIVIVCNNGRYGTIRAHQETAYPGRVSGTELFNPDYAALARAYGATGHSVTRQDGFAEALRAAMRGGLHIIDLRLDPRMLSTTADLPA